jgi:hypothetical protein
VEDEHRPDTPARRREQLEDTARRWPAGTASDLAPAIADYTAMLADSPLETGDPLGLGGLLADAWRIAQLAECAALADGRLLARVLAAARAGLDEYVRAGEWRADPSRRLAFRELGLAIGLAALGPLRATLDQWPAPAPPIARLVDELARHAALGAALGACWSEPAHRRAPAWIEHRDINDVMLATWLAPSGYLDLAPAQP